MSARKELPRIVARIERLEEHKAEIAEDIRQVYLEAKALGFDTKVLRKVIALRKRDPEEREEEAALIDLYMQALGMTPIERAITEAAGAVKDFQDTLKRNGATAKLHAGGKTVEFTGDEVRAAE